MDRPSHERVSFHHLDQFAGVDSVVTRRSPTVRLIGTVVLALGAALLPLGAWPQMVVLGLVVLVLTALARIRPVPFLARLALPLGFVVLVSAALLVLSPGETVARWGMLAVTDEGLVRFASAIGRAAIALGAAVILVATTPFPDVVRALRQLRLPEVVTTSLGLAYRYLYLLIDEVGRLRRAGASRNAAGGAVSRRRLLVGVTAAALQRSFARSERVYEAMLSRGYSGRMPSLDEPHGAGRPILELGTLTVVVGLVVGSAAL